MTRHSWNLLTVENRTGVVLTDTPFPFVAGVERTVDHLFGSEERCWEVFMRPTERFGGVGLLLSPGRPVYLCSDVVRLVAYLCLHLPLTFW